MSGATESQLRAQLGVPADAQRVLLFGESSHWDTNWLKTSEEYFARRIEPILDAVIAALEKDPQRVYCIESVFFLKLFWERRPQSQSRLRQLFQRRQLRLLSSSFTTPDTLLPHPETILRDFQLGASWLRTVGLPDAPGTAYFPDNFGHSPHLPSLMRQVGVSGVGVTRIDGMHFIGCDYRSKAHFPRPGSTAELLEKVHRSHDFIWRSDDGAEVLCHWNAFTYFQGDMLAHTGIIRWAGNCYALPWRTRRHIARRIDRYTRQLAPFARTPYLFCPIGMDFNDPIVDVRELLERYNRERYGTTGTWAVLAGLDDYLRLIDCHREKLPKLEVDPNPYWMGFLATRPEVKQRPIRIARTLLLAEKLSATQAQNEAIEESLREGWNTLVLSNHHDYIPGTSPDRVWHQEQRPWLDAAQAAADRALALAAPAPTDASAPPGEVRVQESGDQVHIQTPHYQLTLSRSLGGCLTSFQTAGSEFLAGLGFDLALFHDEGGLWRLGHEFNGGRFTELERASSSEADVQLQKGEGELTVSIRSQLGGTPFYRKLICRADQPFVRFQAEGMARPRRTVTCRFHVSLRPSALEMDTVGGVIQRPPERLFSPTFWGVPSRVTLRDQRELHALFESPTAASLSPQGALEWIVARNAPKERAFRLLPVLAHPIGGSNSDVQTHEAALLPSFVPLSSAELTAALRQLEQAWLPTHHHAAFSAAHETVRCDTPGVTVTALKRAAAGDGVTVRLFCEQLPPEPIRLWLSHKPVERAFACDALEREHHELTIEAPGRAVVPLSSRLTSIRLI